MIDESIEINKKPTKGNKFTGKIDRIVSGNGIITFDDGDVNIGPVKPDSIGEEITAVMISSMYAICETDDIKADGYSEYKNKLRSYPTLNPSSAQKTSSKNKNTESPSSDVSESPSSGVPESSPSSSSDIPISTEDSPIEFCDECGSMMKVEGKQWVCDSCDSKKKKQTRTTSKKENPPEQSEIDTIESDRESDSLHTEDEPVQHQEEDKEEEKNGEEKNIETSDIHELREKAQNSAVEKVSGDVSTTTTTKPQYNRSTEVKKYVKARADGVCEGCGEPAPFTSKTGEPYLHAHHIHELSDGGSDTPDTVVALCPNCHYRVHHGEDGDEYNQELLMVVQEKENI